MIQVIYRAYQVRAFFLRGGCPATKAIIATNVATLILSMFLSHFLLVFTFNSNVAWSQPWRFITYPLVSHLRFVNPIDLLLAGWVLWLFGGSLERSWGTRAFVRVFFGVAAISALSLWVGVSLVSLFAPAPTPLPLGGSEHDIRAAVGPGITLVQWQAVLGMSVPPALLAGLWLPLAAVIVMWCLIHPDEQILLFFIIPFKGKWLMWLTSGLTWFNFSNAHGFIVGLFSLGGIGVAYAFINVLFRGANRGGRSHSGRFSEGRSNPFTAYRRWRDRERLKRLFRSNGPDDEEKGNDPRVPPMEL